MTTAEKVRAAAEKALSRLLDSDKHAILDYMNDQIALYVNEERAKIAKAGNVERLCEAIEELKREPVSERIAGYNMGITDAVDAIRAIVSDDPVWGGGEVG